MADNNKRSFIGTDDPVFGGSVKALEQRIRDLGSTRVDPNEQHWSGQQKTFFRNLPDDMEMLYDEGGIANPAKMKPGESVIINVKKPPLTS